MRRGRLSDVPRLVRLYLGLSPEARHGFHPFPFRRGALWVLYPAVLAYQIALFPFMRRFPRLIAVLLVVERPGSPELVGYGTIRGVVGPDGRIWVRYGSVVGTGSQGLGIGYAILAGLGEQALDLGVTNAVGTVFRRDDRTVRLCRRFGFQFREIDWVDPGAPEEPTYEVTVDLQSLLRPGTVPGLAASMPSTPRAPAPSSSVPADPAPER